MKLKDMLDPKQAKALSELKNNQEINLKKEIKSVFTNEMTCSNNARKKPVHNLNQSKNSINRSKIFTEKKNNSPTITNNPLAVHVIGDGSEICPMHENNIRQVEHRLISLVNKNGAQLSVTVLHCSVCNKNFIKEKTYLTLLPHIKKGYPIIIKSYEQTLKQMESLVQERAINIKLNIPIYILEETGSSHMAAKCPVHDSDIKLYRMNRNYAKRSVSFLGYFCEYCKKIYVKRSVAEELLYECGEIGIPCPEFITKSGKYKEVSTNPIGQKYPKYLVCDGKKVPFDINLYEVEEWLSIKPGDEILVYFSLNCNLEDHNTDAYWCSIDVLEKSGEEYLYVVKMGHCSTCERYYLSADDYNVIYQSGKAKAVVSDSTGEFDLVKTGHIFDIENEYLIKFQKDADLYIDQLKERYHYIPKYATSSDGYEDIGRLSNGKRECEGLYEEIELISDYMSRPYSNRVDIYHGKNHKVYYIGAVDCNLPGYSNVISRWSELGEKLGNYKSLEIEQDGEKYKVKLRRLFEIIGGRLYGYQNVFSENEKHFRDGLTDPFLVKVLRTRQSQHRLNDILLTIQEKQYEIIEQDLNQSLVVQGCAGSGKTMVLLHRLSYLNYNYKSLDLNKIIILTPNENFNMHIQGLTETLAVSKIERKSIEDYYSALLDTYNNDLTGSYKKELLREENVKSDYVNYIYSDLFLLDMEQAFCRIISECTDFEKFVANVFLEAGIDFTVNENAPVRLRIENISKQARKLISAAELKEIAVNRKEENIEMMGRELKAIQESIQPLTKKIDLLVQSARESIPIVIEQLISERNMIIKEINQMSFLQRLRGIGKRKEIQLEKALHELDIIEPYRKIDWPAVSEEQLLNALKSLQAYRDGLGNDRDILRSQLNLLKIKREREAGLEAAINNEKSELERLMKENWSIDLQFRISELNSRLKAYTSSNIIKRIYTSATERERLKHKIRETKSLYKFDQYAMLYISKRYYDKAIGEHDYLCVDEGQDLSINEYKLLQNINGGRVVFNIFGDVNQLLKKGSGIDNWEAVNKELESNYFVLNENYRNTNQITRYCNEHFNMKVVLTGVEGRSVREIQRHTLETELNKIKLDDERLAILVPRLVKKEQYIDHERLSELISKVIGSVVGNGNIALMYVDEVKGMEFDTVYVVQNGMTDNEKYIAYTRALTELIVVNDMDINKTN